jgi:membrane protease YdiL (CAAX protease family)
MLAVRVSADLLAAALALMGLATCRFERWAFGVEADTRRRLLGYGGIVVLLWMLVPIAAWLYGTQALLRAPLPAAVWLPAPAVVVPTLAAMAAVYFVLSFMPLAYALRGARWRRGYSAAVRRELRAIPGLVPTGSIDRAGWVVLSLTAAVCEELLFRGFLIRFLHSDGSGLLMALALSSFAFGLGHVYQGPKGALVATAGGFAFGLVFLLSGSLVPCVVLHALLDLQMLLVVRPLGEASLAPAVRGVRP